MAEVYAGFLAHADHQIGRLLDYLEESGELDNTIIVLVSDNGASGEGGPNGSVNENKFFNAIPDTIEDNLPYLDKLGSPATYNHYPTGWACAFNTPFKLWKRYSNWEGGTADPMIVSWPARITSAGVRRRYVHAVDIVPTLYSLLGIDPPEVVKGYTQFALEGISFEATLNDAGATTDKQTQFYSMGGTRAIWHQGWKAAALSPAAPDMWARYATQRWELFNTEEDPSECHDLAAQEPEKLQELIDLWWAQAGQYGALPLENRGALEILTTERPQLTKPRNRYVYYPGTAEVPESVAPNIRNRSYTIAVEATIDSQDAAGVLSPTGPGSAGMRCTSRTGGSSTAITSPACRSRSSSRPTGCPPGTRSCRPPSSVRATPCRPRASSPCAWARQRSGEAGSGPSPASSPSPERDSTSAKTAASR
jgi:Sulfatase